MSKQQIISQATQGLLEKLNVAGSVTATQDSVNIETEEAGILIGFHGETIAALELILIFLVSKRIGEFTRISVDVGGYRKQREERLIELVKNIREQVLANNKGQILPNLTASERRIVHLFFQDDKQVTTQSQGEGEARQLIIKPR